MALKLLFLPQNCKNHPTAGGSASSVTRLSCNVCSARDLNWTVFVQKTFACGLSPLSLSKTLVALLIAFTPGDRFFKQLYYQKLQKIAQQLGASPPDPQSLRTLGPPPDPPSVIRLSYTGFLKASSKLRICTFQQYQFKPSSFAKSWLSAKRQIFDDVFACDLWFRPPNQKFGLRL